MAGLCVALIVASSSCSSGDDESTASTANTTSSVEGLPEGVPTPSQEDAAATLAFLDGDGQALLVMHDAATEVTSGQPVDQRTCESIASRLDADAPSGRVAELTSGIADDVLRSALHGQRTELGTLLTACISGAAVDTEGLAESVAAIDSRLAELEAAR